MDSEIISRVKGEESCMAVYREVKQGGDFVAFYRRYACVTDYRVARNALWALTKMTDEEVRLFQPLLSELIQHAMTTPNSSVRRLVLNIVERLQLTEDDVQADFLDFCLEHAIDVQEFPGVQTLCLKLAYKMCAFYPELMGELVRTLETMEVSYYKPAIVSLRKRLLSRIRE